MSGSTTESPRPSRLRLLMVAALLVAGAGIGAVWYGSAHSVGINDAGERPAKAHPLTSGLVLTPAQLAAMTVETVEPRVFHDEVVTEGRIAVNEERATPIYSPYAGRVIALYAKPGDRIAPGQPLFALQAAEMVQAQNDFLAAVAALNKSRSQLGLAQIVERRARTLVEGRAAPLKELQAAENDLAAAQNDLRTAEAALEAARNRLRILGKSDQEIAAFQQKGTISPETVINAPIGGTVVQRKIGPGQYVGAGSSDPAFVIGDLSRVWLMAHVREADAPKVALGQRVQFRVLAYPTRFFAGQVAHVASAVDPGTRRVLVRAEVDNGEGLLKPEMYATVRLVSGQERRAPAVPTDAVVYERDQAHVWVVANENTVQVRRIKGGAVDGIYLEVVEGLRVGEKVVTRGALFLDRLAKGQG